MCLSRGLSWQQVRGAGNRPSSASCLREANGARDEIGSVLWALAATYGLGDELLAVHEVTVLTI